MEIIGDALRQAFMPNHEYQSLRDEDKAWGRLQRPLIMTVVVVLWLSIIVAVVVSLNIVFPADGGKRPLCSVNQMQVASARRDSDVFTGAFYLTEEEAVNYYWMVVFIPSAFAFFASVIYLLAGIAVAYSAPRRHGCLRVVENDFCASKRGGVRCLSILNIVFAIVFGLFALFFGSSILTLRSSCSSPLFWCYEIASWGLVILHGGTAFFLRRKAAVVLDEGNFSGRNLGLEMLEAPQVVTPKMERSVNEGFKSWMGSSFLSSDEEDGPDEY